MSESTLRPARALGPMLLLAACACANAATEAGTGASSPQAATPTETPTVADTNTPATTTPAKVSCATGANDVDVGAACTPSGGECSQLRAGICSADIPGVDEQFCTRLCVAQDCGKGAACINIGAGSAAVAFCAPLTCVPPGTSTTATPAPNPCLTATGTATKHVGKLCTHGGGECPTATGQANTCSADATPGTPLTFCTLQCKVDADCGTGARCETSVPNFPGFCLLTTCHQ